MREWRWHPFADLTKIDKKNLYDCKPSKESNYKKKIVLATYKPEKPVVQGTTYSGSPLSYAPSSPPSYAPSSPPSYAPSALPWDIQNRRLPEPPPLKAGSPDPCYTEAYELPKLPPGKDFQGIFYTCCMLYLRQ